MKSLNEMFHHDKLVDIEETISSEFAQLESGYYDAKLAVMLSFIIATGIKRLEEIDRHDFPAELKEQLDKICRDFVSIANSLKQHLEENSKLIKIIDKANSDYPNIENQIRHLLSEFDELLKVKISQRDSLPICDL